MNMHKTLATGGLHQPMSEPTKLRALGGGNTFDS
jgi:hypothetical protein